MVRYRVTLTQLAQVALVLSLFATRVASFQSPFPNQRDAAKSFVSSFAQVNAAEVMTSANKEESNVSCDHKSSLISSFLVEIIKQEDGDHVWSLTPIEDIVSGDGDTYLSSGAKSWKALRTSTKQSSTPKATLKSRSRGNTVEVEVEAEGLVEEQKDLLFVLTRVMAQFTAASATDNPPQKCNIIISSESSKEELLDVHFTSEGANSLFETDATMEVVDMVDQDGRVLGMVPRSLVHSLNILHRGVGLTVSKDADFSELYVHRRTDFKRIFPSLYDMFVGGVSLSGEDAKLTAAREVAEELGLVGALDDQGQPNHDALSDPLFTCVVCTAYNRCVVTVFQYTVKDPSKETISWQEEEVSWGEFVPYDIVEAAADLSIQRLVSKKEWPGMLPAVQSKWEGSKPPSKEYEGDEWTTWDFVPDGLLVWEAWLRWREEKSS